MKLTEIASLYLHGAEHACEVDPPMAEAKALIAIGYALLSLQAPEPVCAVCGLAGTADDPLLPATRQTRQPSPAPYPEPPL